MISLIMINDIQLRSKKLNINMISIFVKHGDIIRLFTTSILILVLLLK